MRLLFDNSLSWRVARDLRRIGHDTVHVADIGLAESPDPAVYAAAVRDNRILIAQDSDFGPIHVTSQHRVGVVHLRLSDGRPQTHARILADNLPELESPLLNAAFVTIDDTTITIRPSGE